MPAQPHLRTILGCGAALLVAGNSLLAWTPGTGSPSAVQDFVVDATNRTDVLSFYNCIYSASQGYAANVAWTGNVGSCLPGTTSAAFKEDTRRRVNFYRALVGLPGDITFNGVNSSKDQDAALMMSSNGTLNHTPPTTWSCYTATGAQAAGNSNLALGSYGPRAIDGYLVDPGSGNEIVGHRRWILYSRAQEMGTGDIPQNGSFNAANALWVIGNPKPTPVPQYIAWPNRGFVPFPLMPARWSLSYPGANFSAATVTMTTGATNVGKTIISSADNGYGDNTLVWEPVGLPASITADTLYNVTISGITGAGVPPSYSYSVTLFDPAVLGVAVNISGTGTPPTSGATYTFNAIAQSDAYELRVNTASAAAWAEGAEAAAPAVIDNTAASYDLVQTTVLSTGSKAFHLTSPTFADGDQSFEIARDIVPSVTSNLIFNDLFRFVTTASRLSAEVSVDNGTSWTEVWGRNGNGNTSSAGWDTAFQPRSIGLAAYAGTAIRVRFIFRHNNSAFTGTSTSVGIFLDDISVSASAELVNPATTALAAAATSFQLNATTAGAPLVTGATYYMRVRPNVGCRWFGYGPAKVVTVQALTGYAAWVATQYPAVTGGPGADHDFDGISNGIEYAFGQNPTAFTSPLLLPQPMRVGFNLVTSYTQPAGVTGVTYGAEWSRDLVAWMPLADTGAGSTHTFTLNVISEPRVFLRHKAIIAP